MNVGLAMVLSLVWLAFGLLVYSRQVARWVGVDASRTTPAVRHADGVDFVPTKPVILFGHHFASIAAAGPIVGPALAAVFGFVPAWLWLLLGVVLIGAVHDFVALFVSMREGGRSIAEVARRTLGTGGFVLYSLFAILLCILVSAAFLDLTAKTLGAFLPVSLLGLPEDQALLATKTVDGVVMAKVGGIASTSVVAITAMAPILGWMLYRRGASAWLASGLALLGCVVSVWIGLAAPLTLDPTVWMGIVLVYTVVAGFVPVWLIIQPRDFVNVQFLYVGLLVMVAAVVGMGIHGVTIDMPAFNVEQAEGMPGLGALWPFLFITIACGSVSGAHGLIAGGTTSKQVTSEPQARLIGYGGMLLESLLGICVLLLLVGGVGYQGYMAAVWEEGAPGAGIAFALAVGQGLFKGLGSPETAPWIAAYGTVFGILLLEGFLVTTIDTVVRLARYLLEEVWRTIFVEPPRWLMNRMLNTVLVVAPVAVLAFTSGYKTIWPVFGGANQLLAALTLVAASAWLAREGRRWFFVGIPAALMSVTTVVALGMTWQDAVFPVNGAPKPGVAVASTVLLLLAAGVVGLVGSTLLRRSRPSPTSA